MPWSDRRYNWRLFWGHFCVPRLPRAGAADRDRSGTCRSACRGRSHTRRLPAIRGRRRPTRSTNWRSMPGWSTRWPRCRCRSRSSDTGSRPLEVSFMFPLPYDGRHRPDDAAGRRQGISGPAAWTPRKPGGRTRRSCGRTATRPCWNGWAPACSRPASFRCRPGPSGPSRSRYSQLCRQAGRADRFPLPLEHGEIHVAPGRAGEHSASASRASEASRTSTARPTPSRSSGPTIITPRSPTGPRTKCPLRFPPALRRGPRQGERPGCSAIGPTSDDDGYFLLLASPEIKAAGGAAAAKDGDVRDRSFGQHERQEDRAGRRRP